MKKILILGLIVFSMLLQCSCSGKGSETEYTKVRYTDDEYHFVMTYPSSFSGFEKVYNEENDDECTITFSEPDGDKIKVNCFLNEEESFYDYVMENKLEINKIKAFSDYGIIYDKRADKKPSYSLLASTKRMIIEVLYEYNEGDFEVYNDKCDILSFEYSLYANVPKENDFLSSAVLVNGGALSVKVPANAYYTLTPALEEIPYKTIKETVIGEDGKETEVEKQVVDTEKYKGIIIKSAPYFVLLSDTDYKKDFITEENAKSLSSDALAAKLDFVKNITLKDGGEVRKKQDGQYIIRFFECEYNGEKCMGTYTAGVDKHGQMYEFIYAEKENITQGEHGIYEDVLSSVNFLKPNK